MKLQQGMCISSNPSLTDPNFINTTIFLTEVNTTGAAGFMLNRSFGRKLNELSEFSHSKAFPLYTGGPVDQEHLYFIHRQPLLISGGQPITDNVYFGGNFNEAVEAINATLLTTADLRIFVGYCGWNAGELEVEIAEGSWEIGAVSTDKIFNYCNSLPMNLTSPNRK